MTDIHGNLWYTYWPLASRLQPYSLALVFLMIALLDHFCYVYSYEAMVNVLASLCALFQYANTCYCVDLNADWNGLTWWWWWNAYMMEPSYENIPSYCTWCGDDMRLHRVTCVRKHEVFPCREDSENRVVLGTSNQNSVGWVMTASYAAVFAKHLSVWHVNFVFLLVSLYIFVIVFLWEETAYILAILYTGRL